MFKWLGFFPQNGLQNTAVHNIYKLQIKNFSKDAARRCTKKLIPKNKRNLQYCVTKLNQTGSLDMDKEELWNTKS